MAFAKATKTQAKLRAALFGPSGAGKTFSALRIATGMLSVTGGNIAGIDTERGSMSKYADHFEFDVMNLEDRSTRGYIAAIGEAAAAGYAILVIDSMSHGWQELKLEVDRLARAKYQGNTWAAWSEGTPLQQAFINALLDFPGHVLATMRSKTEWTTEKTDRGKNKPVRVGLTPEQRGGVEYEFDILMELNAEHIATVIKDRTGKFQDQLLEKPGEEFGIALAGWLNEGDAPEPAPPAGAQIDAARAKWKSLAAEFGDPVVRAGFADTFGKSLEDWKSEGGAFTLDMMTQLEETFRQPTAA